MPLRHPLFLAALFLLTACAGNTFPPQEAQFLHELADRPVTCEGKADCAKKWARAVQWIKGHSRIWVALGYEDFRIIKLTKNIVQTNVAHNLTLHQGNPAMFTVAKLPREDGSYEFQFTTVCDRGRICKPSGLELRASFVSAVIGLPEGVSEPSPDVFEKHISQ